MVENVYDANGYLLAKRSPAGQVNDYDKDYLASLKNLVASRIEKGSEPNAA